MEGGPPGVIAVIQRGQHREVHTFGVANVRTGRPMRIHDRMRIASAAKAFSGAVALSLVSEGKLSLHDTIGERLPESPEAWSEVTLRQLLNHTSGIPDFSLDPDFQEALLASLKTAPRRRSCSPSWRMRICSSIRVLSTTTQTPTTSSSP
jgi:D-alanyl-D-alanine carboxypeptidase